MVGRIFFRIVSRYTAHKSGLMTDVNVSYSESACIAFVCCSDMNSCLTGLKISYEVYFARCNVFSFRERPGCPLYSIYRLYVQTCVELFTVGYLSNGFYELFFDANYCTCCLGDSAVL